MNNYLNYSMSENSLPVNFEFEDLKNIVIEVRVQIVRVFLSGNSNSNFF